MFLKSCAQSHKLQATDDISLPGRQLPEANFAAQQKGNLPSLEIVLSEVVKAIEMLPHIKLLNVSADKCLLEFNSPCSKATQSKAYHQLLLTSFAKPLQLGNAESVVVSPTRRSMVQVER